MAAGPDADRAGACDVPAGCWVDRDGGLGDLAGCERDVVAAHGVPVADAVPAGQVDAVAGQGVLLV